MGDLAILEILLTGEKHVLEGKTVCSVSFISGLGLGGIRVRFRVWLGLGLGLGH